MLQLSSQSTVIHGRTSRAADTFFAFLAVPRLMRRRREVSVSDMCVGCVCQVCVCKAGSNERKDLAATLSSSVSATRSTVACGGGIVVMVMGGGIVVSGDSHAGGGVK